MGGRERSLRELLKSKRLNVGSTIELNVHQGLARHRYGEEMTLIDTSHHHPQRSPSEQRRRDYFQRQRAEFGERARLRRECRPVYDPFGPKPEASNDRDRRSRDKFYTSEVIARECHKHLAPFLPPKAVLIDPAAGAGVFLHTCDERRDIFGVEKFPDRHARPDLLPRDFLKIKDLHAVLTAKYCGRNLGMIGSPPYGWKLGVAVEFINHGFALGVQTIGFVLGRSARTWTVQSRIDKRARLVLDVDLEDRSVHLAGKPQDLRLCFQVWTLSDEWPDLRIPTRPVHTHPDFRMATYNTRSGAEHLEGDWSFAIQRTGYYLKRAGHGQQLDRSLKWIMMWPSSAEVEARLRKIDFDALAQSRTIGTPGFGMTDVVRAYEEIVAREM